MERDFMGLTIKQEILEEPETDQAEVARNSAMQWSFSNNKAQENNNNNKPKIGFESLASAGLVTITTTTEVVDTIHRPYTTQIGAQYYSSSQTRGGVVGTTELRGAPRTLPGPAQLTMFYAGSVCVYDNICPEKAQAIMLLAGNAPPVTPISTASTSTASPVQTIRNSSSLDRAFVSVNKCHGTSTSNNTNETTIIRSIGVLKSPSNTTEFSAVPQARRASLARFLERRKERVVSASPYGTVKQSLPVSGNWSFSMNSSGSSTPLPATN